MSRVWRLYKTGIGSTTGFIKHSYNTCLHFTVYCNTHTQTNLLSPGAVSPVVTSQRRCFLSSLVLRLRSSGLIFSRRLITHSTDSTNWLRLQLCHQLYSPGTRLFLLLRHVGFTVPLASSALQLLRHPSNTSHFTVAWSPSNGCKQMPYCLQRARHISCCVVA
jgi:hypothetical protein